MLETFAVLSSPVVIEYAPTVRHVHYALLSPIAHRTILEIFSDLSHPRTPMIRKIEYAPAVSQWIGTYCTMNSRGSPSAKLCPQNPRAYLVLVAVEYTLTVM